MYLATMYDGCLCLCLCLWMQVVRIVKCIRNLCGQGSHHHIAKDIKGNSVDPNGNLE